MALGGQAEEEKKVTLNIELSPVERQWMPICNQNPLDVSAEEGNAVPFISGHHLVPLLIHQFPRAGGGEKKETQERKKDGEEEEKKENRKGRYLVSNRHYSYISKSKKQ